METQVSNYQIFYISSGNSIPHKGSCVFLCTGWDYWADCDFCWHNSFVCSKGDRCLYIDDCLWALSIFVWYHILLWYWTYEKMGILLVRRFVTFHFHFYFSKRELWRRHLDLNCPCHNIFNSLGLSRKFFYKEE